ncbi:MAG: helix-turn-helix domain-containing protein [Hydrogenibacillus sp.]|nr:helix-turn-helix domain-containing protein [Hydrogenibacillus sp.]
MEEQLQRLGAALAVPTRFAIYQYVLRHPDGVNVQDVADRFGIHPNVARLHLSKLEEAELVQSRLEHTGRGGRPGRMYTPAEKAVSLSLPPRDYETLADIALSALKRFKHQGEQMLAAVAEERGYEMAKRYIEEQKLDVDALTPEDIVRHVQKITNDPGLSPNVQPIDAYAFRFAVHACAYKEALNAHPNVCAMHHALLKGLFRAFLGKCDLIEEYSLLDGAPACQYIAVTLP